MLEVLYLSMLCCAVLCCAWFTPCLGAQMPLQEALDVAEALVLLPEVDSVAPGRQMYTRATAQDLQVLP